jgi:hypothetical protein
MKTSELIGHALNYAVILAKTPRAYEGKPSIRDIVVRYPYSTTWAMSGPIIEREGIMLVRHTAIPALNCGEYYWKANQTYGPTPLIAAMRCYVASKLGDEVDVPEELK